MGKNILVQRRGRGTSVFLPPTHRRVAPVTYPSPSSEAQAGVVSELVHDPGRGAPLALVRTDDGSSFSFTAPEGLWVSQRIMIGSSATAEIGNIMPLGKIPEGTYVCNIELTPGYGAAIARGSGSYALVVSHTPSGTQVKLPSGRLMFLMDSCRATIGVVAGAGRTEKPFLRAGPKHWLMRSRGRRYPVVKAQAMISASHPYGGGRHKHAGKPTTVGRWTPPGRKVGNIAARQTGRAKRRAR